MDRLEPKEVRRIARLARLELREEEVERLAEEMDSVLRRFREVEAAAAASNLEEGRTEPGVGDPGVVELAELGPEEEGAGVDVSAPAARPGSDEPGSDPLLRSPDRFAPDWRDGHFVTPSPATWHDDPDASPPSAGPR